MPAPRNSEAPGDVLSQLPSTRPQRASARRTRPSGAKGPGSSARKTAPKRSAATKGAARKPSRTPRSRAPAAAPGDSSTPRAVRPSAATNRTREPGPQAGSARRPAARPAPARSRQGVHVVETAVQAAGELAQIGMTIGMRALRGAISRLPRP